MPLAYLDNRKNVVTVNFDDPDGMRICMDRQDSDRSVARDDIRQNQTLSTVFLGFAVDNGWFETALFDSSSGSPSNVNILRRYATYIDAAEGHKECLKELLGEG